MGARIYGLVGRTLSHSYSVPIHRELGNEDYRLIELEPEQLGAFLRRGDIGGLNVTIPYKKDAMAYCDALDQTALAVGCVNTVVRRADGLLAGSNTDAYGLAYMAERAGIRFDGKKTLIFGSGGASLTARFVAKTGGSREVAVISRGGTDNYETLDRHADAQVLVNATPVGMYPHAGAMIADPAAFPKCCGVLELVYNPRRTAFLLRAEELGIPCSDGLPMLVAQAKAAEERFLGRAIPNAEIERILRLLRRDRQNIVLIGMPGSGKSTVGRALAELTGRTAVDLDEAIERAAGRPIPEIFEKLGEEAFRRMEREQAQKWGMESGIVLIAGGGIVKRADNYAALRQNGRIYQILRDIALLDRAGRPLSLQTDLAEMLRTRQPLYERFRDAAVENNTSAEAAARAIWEEYCENSDR